MLWTAQAMTADELCHRHGVAVYQVGQVYGNAPPEFLKKYFVAVTVGDFPGVAIEAIPLAESEEEAYRIAVTALKLEDL